MRERRGRRADRGAIILGLIAVVVVASGLYAYLQLRVDQVTAALRRREPLAVAVLVSDGERLGFVEVLLYNPATRKAALYHVPANLGGVIESLDRVDGIDALYRRSNPGPLVDRVGRVLGLSINCWMDMTASDVGRLADLLGGLELFIPNPVDVTWQGRRILLPSGSVRLDGDKVRDYLAYEDPLEPEAERIAREQKLVQALLAGFGAERALLAQRSVSRMLRTFVRTSLPPRALQALIEEMGRFDAERTVLQRLLGSLTTVGGRQLLFPHQDGDLAREAIRQTLAANASTEYTSAEELSITVEVQNGTTTPGLAARARELFMSFDLEVLPPRNADNDRYERTVVIDRRGRPEDARRVADIIRCKNVIEGQKDPADRTVDVTVILGRDFDGRYVK